LEDSSKERKGKIEMIDIHSHFIAGLDDGPEAMRETEAIMETYYELGFTHVVETTHCYPGLFEVPDERLTEITSRMKKSNIKIFSTREYFVDFNFLEKLEKKNILPYPDGKHILIEFSFSIPPINWEHIIFKIVTEGYIPILAHPERYEWISSIPQFVEEFKRRGGLLQGNMGSFAGIYGRYIKKQFLKLLNEKMYDFLATDTHSHSQLKLIGQTLPVLRETACEKYWLEMTEENPLILLEESRNEVL